MDVKRMKRKEKKKFRAAGMSSDKKEKNSSEGGRTAFRLPNKVRTRHAKAH